MRAAINELIQIYGENNPIVQQFIDSLVDGTMNDKLSLTHEMVDIETFITDEYFAGTVLKNIWDESKKSIIEVVTGGYNEAIFTGSTGRSKTQRSTIITAYQLYQLSCYENPQAKLGLLDTSEIVIAMMNKNDTLAKNVTYKKFRNLVGLIPYFKENFMFDKRLEKSMEFDKGIVVEYSAATNDRLLGKDVVGGILDEANFMDVIAQSKRAVGGGEYDQAVEVYNGIVRRIKSRFLGKSDITGCLSIVSSRSYKDDFIGRRMDEIAEGLKSKDSAVRKDASKSYIDTGSQWDMQPPLHDDGSVRYSGKRFKFAIANEKLDCQILENGVKALGREVIEIPIEVKTDFIKDAVGSLKDLAGRVITNTGKFMELQPIMNSTVQFTEGVYPRIFGNDVEHWDLSRGLPPFNKNYKLYNNFVPRFVHFDLSLTGDRLGIGVGHSPSDILLGHHAYQNHVDREQVVNVIYDDFIAITPPEKGQIKFADVRRILYHMKHRMNIPIKWVSLDGFQSADFMQIIEDKGFETKRISVEGEEAYTALRTAFYENRVVMPLSALVVDELTGLIQDEKTKRVDHTVLSEKDVSDCLAGIYKHMLFRHKEGVLYKLTQSLMTQGLYLVKNQN